MTDIFTPVAPTTQQPNETQQPQDFYSELVGEGKKFKDNEALARSKYEADQHIDRLQKEMKGLREDLNARLTLESLVDKLEQKQQTQLPSGNLDNTNVRSPSGNETEQSQINPQLIDSLVDKKLSDFEKARRRSENASLVQKELRDRFGDNYVVHLENEAQKMGVGKEFLNNLAAEEPRAFLQLFPGRQQNVDLGPSPRSSVQSTFRPTNNNRTEKYYEQLRIDNPKTYWDPKTQMQLHNDALQQGESFFDAGL